MQTSENNKLKIGFCCLIPCLTFFLLPIIAYPQTVADFSVDDSIGCTPSMVVHFTNEGSTGVNYSYKWYFGSMGTSTNENPTFTFTSPATHIVSFVVTNTSNSEKDSITKNIIVYLTPSANLAIDSSNACVRGRVVFQAGFSSKDSARWDFGDGTTDNSFSSYMSHIYTAYGTYPVSYITYYKECSDTSTYQLKVDGPIATIGIIPEEACKGASVQFTMTPVYDVTSYSWNLGEGDIQTNNPASHTYETMGYNTILLTINGISGSCTIEDTVHIYEVVASFDPPEALCNQQLVIFSNTSTNNDENSWDFGNGTSSMAEDGSAIYSSGTYTVRLWVGSAEGCADSTEQVIVVNTPPVIGFGDTPMICPGEAIELSATGGNSIEWFPPEEFNDPHSFTPTVTPDSTMTYTATITDTMTHCSNSGQVKVIVQAGFIPDKITVTASDDSIIIGETVQVLIFDSLNRELSYGWTPTDWVSCTDCDSIVLQPMEPTVYTLVISDTNQCFSSESFTIDIAVREEYRIGVPEAFTPNGDQINDIIKVDGWGIRRLIEFRIYNRWGTEVFFTDDINQGWDGNYNDRQQSIDSYSYIIKAEMWDNNITAKQGTFSLLR